MWRTNVRQMDSPSISFDRSQEWGRTLYCRIRYGMACTWCKVLHSRTIYIHCGLIRASATLKVHQLSSCHRVNGKNINWKIEKKSERTNGRKRMGWICIVTRTQFILALTHIAYHSNCSECRKLLQALLHTFNVHLNTRYSQCRWINELVLCGVFCAAAVLRVAAAASVLYICHCNCVVCCLLRWIYVIFISGIDGKGQSTPDLCSLSFFFELTYFESTNVKMLYKKETNNGWLHHIRIFLIIALHRNELGWWYFSVNCN